MSGRLEERVHRRVEVDLVGTSVERRTLEDTAPTGAGAAVTPAHQGQAGGDLMGAAGDLDVGCVPIQRLEFSFVVTLAGHGPFVRPRRWRVGEWARTAEGDTPVLTVGGGDEQGRWFVERLRLTAERCFRIAGLVALERGIGHDGVLSARGRGQAEEIRLPDVVQHLFGRDDSGRVELDPPGERHGDGVEDQCPVARRPDAGRFRGGPR